MAEYLSLGPVDAQTAMWMRDAALREKLPHIKDLDDPKYFPYRWGHAFWAYIGAQVRRPHGRVADSIGGQSAVRSRRSGAPARHRSRHADRRLARRRSWRRRARSPTISPPLSSAAAARHRRAQRRRALQRRSARQSRRHARSRSSPSAIAFRSSCILADVDTGQHRAQAVEDRRPIRTSTVWSS